MVITIAAILFALSCVTVTVFQMLLAGGKPWGEYAMGGKFPGVLPPAFRVAAVFQAALLLWFAAIMLRTAGMLPFPIPGDFSFSGNVLFGFSVVAALMNTATPSLKERYLWAPVCWLMAVSSGIVLFYTP